MLAALTVLPATLRLLGRRVDAGRLPWRRHRPVEVNDAHGRWAALARGVMRRPWLVIGVTVDRPAAARLAVPRRHVGQRRLQRAARRTRPPTWRPRSSPSSARRPRPPRCWSRGASEADIAAYAEQVAQVDGVLGVQPVATEGDCHAAARLVGGQQPDRGRARTSSSRSARSNPPPARCSSAASQRRRPSTSSTRSARTCRWMGLIVAGVMLVLLFLAFGSLVLPVKAVVMNLFSITASFGVVTWIFSRRPPLRPARLHAAGLPRRDQPDPDAGHPVRPLDGLRGVPALPGPRAVGPHR